MQIKSKARGVIDLNKVNLSLIEGDKHLLSYKADQGHVVSETAPLSYHGTHGSTRWRAAMTFTLQGYTLTTELFYNGVWVPYDHGYTEESTWDELARWLIDTFYFSDGKFDYDEEGFYDLLHAHLSDELGEAYDNLVTDGLNDLRAARKGQTTKTFG